MAERNVSIDPDASMRELLRLLDVSGDSIKVDVSGAPIAVNIRHASETSNLSFEEKLEIARSALGGWSDYIDLDELEREIYAARDGDPVKPDVVLD